MKEEDIDGVYQRAGLTHQLGFGQRPALMIVDMQIGFTEPEKSKIAGDFGSQIEVINKLISVARGKETPVIFTAIAYEAEKQADGGLWVNKIPALHSLVRGSELVEIDSRLRSDHEDLIIYKKFCFSVLRNWPVFNTVGKRNRHSDSHGLHDQRLYPCNRC